MTERDATAVANQAIRKAKTRAPARLAVTSSCDGVVQIQVNHSDAAIAEAVFRESMGTSDETFATAISEQLGFLAQVGGEISERKLNEHLAFVRCMAPNSELETALAAQMAAIHSLTMSTAATAKVAKGKAKDMSLAQLNKLARTFAAQAEAFRRLRGGGEQRVVVEHRHFHVAPGAQAIFGDVTTGGQEKITEQPHVPSLPQRQAMLSDVQANG